MPRSKGEIMETMELYRGRLVDHVQLVVRDIKKSRAFYDSVFEALGIPLGGEFPGYYAAFLLDPDGNNIEAVYHGPHKRSAAAVKITF